MGAEPRYNVDVMKSPKFPDWPEDEMKAYLKGKYNPAKGRGVPYFMDKLGVSRRTAYNYLKEAGIVFWRSSDEVTVGEYRTCRICKKDKLLSKFYKDKTKSRGRKYVCRACTKEGKS